MAVTRKILMAGGRGRRCCLIGQASRRFVAALLSDRKGAQTTVDFFSRKASGAGRGFFFSFVH